MAFCPSCGKPLTQGTSHCGNCGAFVGAPGSGAPASAAYTQVPAPAQPAASSPPITVGSQTSATSSSSGITTNAAGALCYLAGFITGIIFLVVAPYNRDAFIRFHAFQSIFFNVAWMGFWIIWTIFGMVLSAVTKGLFFLIQMPVDLIITLGGFCLWGYLMYSASQNKTFKLPILGALAAKQAGL